MSRPRRRLSAYTLFDRLSTLRDRIAGFLAGKGCPTPRTALLNLEAMEDRIVPDGRPFPFPTIFAGAGAGHAPVVRGFDAETGNPTFTETVYSSTFMGGVRVAAGDFTGDGYPDVVVAPGPGHAPRIRILDGSTGQQVAGDLGSFLAFGKNVTGGVFVAAADVDGDGTTDVVAAAVTANGPLVRVFSGATSKVIAQFEVTGAAFAGGVTVAAADLTLDGKAEVVVGASGSGRVRVYAPLAGQVIAGPLGAFDAFGKGVTGVYVGADAIAGDVNGDGTPDIAVGTRGGSTAMVRVFDGKTGAQLLEVTPFGSGFVGGARAALAYVDNDEFADVVVGSGPGMTNAVKVFSGATGEQLTSPPGEYTPFGSAFVGVFVAASNDPLTPMLSWTTYPPNSVEGQVVRAVVKVTGTQFPSPLAPTGTVTFTASDMSNSFTLETVTLVASGNGYEATATIDFGSLPVGNYTLTATYNGDANFSSGSTFWLNSVSAPASGVPLARAGTGRSLEPILDAPGEGEADRNAYSPSGVMPGTGTVDITRVDLASGGYGLAWFQGWTWTNAQGTADGRAGSGGSQPQAPHVVQVNGDNSLAVVAGGAAVHFFDLVGGSYRARFGDTATLSHDTTNHLYVLTDGTGQTFKFYDYSGSTPTGRTGQLKSATDANGALTEVTSWDGSGRPTEVQRVSGSGSSALTESFLATYITSGTNTGLLSSVTQRTKVGTGSWSTVRSTEYTYYDGTSGPGLAGALKSAVVKDAAGNTIDTSYYRYYTSGTGTSGKLKYAFGPEAYGRLVAALGTSLDSLTDGQVDDYADVYLNYDSSGRVTTITNAAAGSSVSGGGLGTYTFTYTTNPTTNLRDPNVWAVKTVETQPDGSTTTYYTNADGQVILTDFDDAGASGNWLKYLRYDSAGRLVLLASPAAVTGYSDSYGDLVNFSGATAQYLSDSAGLFTTWTYGTSTTATSSTAGDVLGYLKQVAIQQGETGTSRPQEAVTYLSRTSGGNTVFKVAADTVYRNDDGTGGQTTSFAYTYFSGTNQVESVVTTLPVVTTAQNGSNSATSVTTFRDVFGRPVWTKDQDGFIAYVEYDTVTGGVVKVITDVDTSQTGTFTGLPSGWSTPSGGGRHNTANYEVDALGRVTKETTPEGRVNYTVFDDDSHEVRMYLGWDSGTNLPTGPTIVMREDRANGYSEVIEMSATPTVSSGRPTGTESVSNVQSLSRTHVNAAGQVIQTDEYFNLSGLSYSTSASLGTEGTHFYRTRYQYDTNGNLCRVQSHEGTIYRTVFDGQRRPVSEWVGTDDTPTSGSWSPSNLTGTDMVKVREYEYDAGGVGNGNVTKVTEIPGGGAANRVTQFWHDWRNRVVAVKRGVEGSESTSVNRPLTYFDYDNLGQVTKTRVYDADGVSPSITSGVPQPLSSSLLRGQTTFSYDELGREYRSDIYSVNPTTGSVSTNSLQKNVWRDARGNVIKMTWPGGRVMKWGYDGDGNAIVVSVTDGGGDASYADADDVTGDTELERYETEYNDDGDAIRVLTRQRFHDASGTGALGSPSSGIGARVSYEGFYYDYRGRLTARVNVGTNGGSSWTMPGTVPSRSDTVLVYSYTFDSAGNVYEMTDPRGLITRYEYDALHRTTKTIENYVNGTVSDADDKTVTFAYNSVGMTSLTAHLTGGGSQTTQWMYGVTTAGGSVIASNDLVGATRWPDPSTGSASSSEQETRLVNALGEVTTATDRNGNVHTYTRDVLGRITIDAVTTLGSGVNGSVRRIEYAYDGQGNVCLITSYDAASGGNIVNQVQREFNGLGQLITEYQEHGGAVNTSASPKVQYAFSEMASGANHSRLVSMTYPNGRTITYDYGSSGGLNDLISRLAAIKDGSTTLEGYSYLGLATVVVRSHPEPDVDLTYAKRSGESNGDAGDQYIGLDRFGRIADQRWIVATSGTARDRFQYTYDRDSNRTATTNVVNSAFNESYGYDGLNQITSFSRGSHTISWDHDALGNFESVTTDGGSPESRTHNKQNELTQVGSNNLAYDANGNMTTDETGKTYVYDAWNRLVEVKNGGTSLVTYKYDGLNRRIVENPGTARDLYYSASWQVLEERISGTARISYVWSPVYIDAMICRDRDSDNNGSLEERLYVTHDANFNVTALVNTSGVVVERFAGDPFGKTSVYDASHGTRTSSSYDWQYEFQGLRRDATTGNYLARHRELGTAISRFTSLDPIRYDAGDPNLYRFVGNRPVNATDPAGQYEHQYIWDFPFCSAMAMRHDCDMAVASVNPNRAPQGGMKPSLLPRPSWGEAASAAVAVLDRWDDFVGETIFAVAKEIETFRTLSKIVTDELTAPLIEGGFWASLTASVMFDEINKRRGEAMLNIRLLLNQYDQEYMRVYRLIWVLQRFLPSADPNSSGRRIAINLFGREVTLLSITPPPYVDLERILMPADFKPIIDDWANGALKRRT